MPVSELLVGGSLLFGGLYALMECGLNLIFGVMRLIRRPHPGRHLTNIADEWAPSSPMASENWSRSRGR